MLSEEMGLSILIYKKFQGYYLKTTSQVEDAHETACQIRVIEDTSIT